MHLIYRVCGSQDFEFSFQTFLDLKYKVIPKSHQCKYDEMTWKEHTAVALDSCLDSDSICITF